MAKKRIGILTGGGDVPGLNAVIKSVTYRGCDNQIEVLGLRRGWEALTHLNVEDPASMARYVVPLLPIWAWFSFRKDRTMWLRAASDKSIGSAGE